MLKNINFQAAFSQHQNQSGSYRIFLKQAECLQQEVSRERSTPTGTVALDYNKRWAERAPLLQVQWHENTTRGGQRDLHSYRYSTVALDYNKRWADRAQLLQVEWHEATTRGGQRLLYNKGWAPANPKFNAAYLNAINPQVSGRNLSAKYKN